MGKIELEVRAIRQAVQRLERTMGGRFERTALPLREAAAQLGVSSQQLATMIRLGELRTTRVDGRAMVPVGEVKRVNALPF